MYKYYKMHPLWNLPSVILLKSSKVSIFSINNHPFYIYGEAITPVYTILLEEQKLYKPEKYNEIVFLYDYKIVYTIYNKNTILLYSLTSKIQ